MRDQRAQRDYPPRASAVRPVALQARYYSDVGWLEAVRIVQPARTDAGTVGRAVLPDDAPCLWVEYDHPRTAIVGHRDRAVWQGNREARVVESAGASGRAVAPQEATLRIDREHGAWVRVVGDDYIAVRVELRVGRVRGRHVDVEDDVARGVEPDNARAADLGDQQAAVGQRRVAVRDRVADGRSVRADPRLSPLADDPLVWRDLDDPTVSDVRYDHVAVSEPIRVVRSVQVAGQRAGAAVMAILPDDPACRDVDPEDHLVTFLVGGERSSVRREEGVVGAEGLARGQASGDGEAPDDPSAVVHGDDPAVAAARSEQATRERPGGSRRPGGKRRGLGGRGRPER